MGKIRILSYNIHKGFSAANFRFVLKKIRESIEIVHADIVLLQEVLGQHDTHSQREKNWPTTSQFEFLADKIWPHFAYGKNAVYSEGHHGNAILSKYPIKQWDNIDVSTNRLERRGFIHAVIEVPEASSPFHIFCLHLGLFEAGRKKQLNALCDRIAGLSDAHSPLIVGGDFNDWREKASSVLEKKLSLKEAFMELKGEHARTFPCWLPALKLDRIYYRACQPIHAQVYSDGLWSELSDHAAIYCELEY